MSDGSPEGWECDESCPIRLMNLQSGVSKSTARTGFPGGTTFGGSEMKAEVGHWYGDSGGAARFFPNFSQEDSLEVSSAEARVIVGDCTEVMREMPESSVDAIVTDPPYGLEFMGKEWDRLSADPNIGKARRSGFDNPNVKAEAARAMQEWHERWAREALRVLKPGGHLLAFGGTRTYHRLACAIEDAGFEIRDRILHMGGGDAVGAELAWVYGSG